MTGVGVTGVARAPSPASVLALGATRCAAVVWRIKGQLRLTAIVKATFDLVPGGAMTPAAPEEVAVAEVHHRKQPSQSVRLTSDLAPFLPAADVVLTGHACAPEGKPVQALTVRLAVFREGPLFEKVVHVYGDRNGSGEVAPFSRVPLVYERAVGGAGYEHNPLGTGRSAGEAAPNLVDPADPQRTACFAPVSEVWPARKRTLDRAQREGLKHPVVEIVGELDFRYFHAAPPDQRVSGYLRGSEWIVLDGMSPTQPSVQSRLPDAVGAARVYGPGEPDGREIAMVADTLCIDADRMVCSVVWRGHVVVPDERALASLDVVGGVSLGNQPIPWPARLPEAALAEYESLSEASSLDGTMELPNDPAELKRALPFVAGIAATLPAPAPRGPARSAGSTVAVDPEDEAPVARQKAVPFVAPRAVQASSPLDGTMDFADDPEAALKRTLPFVTGIAATLPAPEPREPVWDAGFTVDSAENLGAALLMPFVVPVGSAPALPGQVPTFLRNAPRTNLGLGPPPAETPVEAKGPREAQKRKAARQALGIDLFPDGPLAIEVVPWGLEPARDVITLIAKATCDLIPDGPAVPRPAADPPSGEVTAGSPPRVVRPSDLVPYKVRADVVLVGHAFAKEGSATSMEVALRFGSEENGFDRRVMVYGDRRWKKARIGVEPSAPEPFERMPIAFDRAFGGPRFLPNPVGVGHGASASRPLPNLEDPEQLLRSPAQTPPPAVFAPIPLAWKDRWAAAHESGVCLAETLDWSRFQAAPAAQQVAFLRGDEPFVLTGLSARYPVLSGTLPGTRARGFVAWKDARSSPAEPPRLDEVALRLDTVVFDVDAMTVTLVWRGAVPVADERAPDVEGLYLIAEPIGAETPLAEVAAKVLRPS